MLKIHNYPGCQLPKFPIHAYFLSSGFRGAKSNILNHANYLAFKADEAAWHSLFTRARLNRAGKQHPKGFIEIYY